MVRIKKISDFNVGDIVKINSVLVEYDSYVPELQYYLGQEGIIIMIRRKSFRIKFKNGDQWWFPRACISHIDEQKSIKFVKPKMKVLVGKELNRTNLTQEIYNKIGILTGETFWQSGTQYATLIIDDRQHYLPICVLFDFEPIYESKKIIRTLDD